MSEVIALTRDHAADAVAIVKLLRSNQPDMAMFIVSSYAGDNDGLQGLAGAIASFASVLLDKIDSIAADLNRNADRIIPGADAVLTAAAAAVVSFNPVT